jgi:hypothetical protein
MVRQAMPFDGLRASRKSTSQLPTTHTQRASEGSMAFQVCRGIRSSSTSSQR